MRSPLTHPPARGASVLTLLPTCCYHIPPCCRGGQLEQYRCWPCRRASVWNRWPSRWVLLPSLTKPPCGGPRASWLLGSLASTPAWAQLASVCTPSLHACLCHLQTCSPLPYHCCVLPLLLPPSLLPPPLLCCRAATAAAAIAATAGHCCCHCRCSPHCPRCSGYRQCHASWCTVGWRWVDDVARHIGQRVKSSKCTHVRFI